MIRRLITDRDVLTGAVRPPIVLDDDTLITPSARDRAMRLGWEVVERGAHAPSAAADRMPAHGRGDAHASARGGCCGNCGGDCARCGRAGCAGGCSRATGAGLGAPLGALPDGLYLVRIEGGRAVSALPAGGPGVVRRAGDPGPAR